MHITLNEPSAILWEGELEPSQGAKGIGDVRAAIRMPVQWDDGQLLGDKWQPPLGSGRFHLTRLVFSLSARGRTQITRAEFCLGLSPIGGKAAMVFDGFPREQTVEQDRSVTLEFGPSLKVTDAVEASLGKVATTIDYGRVIPVVHTEGLQSERLCWRHRAHAKYPLIGDRVMYAVIALPPGAMTAEAMLDLAVTCQDQLGPIRLGTPAQDRYKLQWVVGQT